MQNKGWSGGPDKRLKGINVKSSSKRTLGGGGKGEKRETESAFMMQTNQIREHEGQI